MISICHSNYLELLKQEDDFSPGGEPGKTPSLKNKQNKNKRAGPHWSTDCSRCSLGKHGVSVAQPESLLPGSSEALLQVHVYGVLLSSGQTAPTVLTNDSLVFASQR